MIASQNTPLHTLCLLPASFGRAVSRDSMTTSPNRKPASPALSTRILTFALTERRGRRHSAGTQGGREVVEEVASAGEGIIKVDTIYHQRL